MKGRDAKPHIGIFGRRNNGKSSVINILAEQEVAIVSELPGTTTDPVRKSVEITGIGPVIFIDTAGIDDTGELGSKRVDKTLEALKTVDAAILVIADNEFGKPETDLIKKFLHYDIPFFIIHNKSDIVKINNTLKNKIITHYPLSIIHYPLSIIDFSCHVERSETSISDIINLLKKTIPPTAWQSKSLIGDLLTYGDTVLLITPIDIEAPEGRLILPQVQVIRDILDNDCVAVILKERELDVYMKNINNYQQLTTHYPLSIINYPLSIKPKLVITDSQVFLKADAAIPKDIPLTSFSIVLARHKGDFQNYLKGTPYISKLKDGDKVLILESCSHHVSCDDIGRVKIPRWLTNFTGKKLEFEVIAGLDKLPDTHYALRTTHYALVVQCGGCMITKKQLLNRLKPFVDEGIPVTNYGMTIAYIHGIYERAVSPFVNISKEKISYL